MYSLIPVFCSSLCWEAKFLLFIYLFVFVFVFVLLFFSLRRIPISRSARLVFGWHGPRLSWTPILLLRSRCVFEYFDEKDAIRWEELSWLCLFARIIKLQAVSKTLTVFRLHSRLLDINAPSLSALKWPISTRQNNWGAAKNAWRTSHFCMEYQEYLFAIYITLLHLKLLHLRLVTTNKTCFETLNTCHQMWNSFLYRKKTYVMLHKTCCQLKLVGIKLVAT